MERMEKNGCAKPRCRKYDKNLSVWKTSFLYKSGPMSSGFVADVIRGTDSISMR